MKNMLPRRKRPVLWFFVLFSMSGCMQGHNNAEKPAVEQPKSEVFTVEISNMKFVPDSLVIKKGDKIVFVNRDMVNHCVTEEKSKAWTTGVIPAGESHLIEVGESADYFCAIHNVMKGKIIVR